MKIILFVTKYPERIDDSYLPSEIADQWAQMGHDVTVAVVQWENKGSDTATKSMRFPSGVIAHYFAPLHITRWGKLVERISRWSLSSLMLRSAIAKAIGPASDYDAVLFFAPLVIMGFQITDYVRPSGNNYAYITDFFPYAHRDLGLVPSGSVFAVARWVENRLLRRFRCLGTMSPRNASYLREHYAIDPGQRVFVDMLWGPEPVVPSLSREAVRQKFGLPTSKKILIFGGQLTEGRGLEEVIDAAALAPEDFVFLIIGNGRMRQMVEKAAEQCPALIYLPPLPRVDYLTLASACDVGLVVTIKNTDVPTFPSRTIDYLRVGLPILASVERSTDYGEIVMECGLGVAIEAGEPQRLIEAADALLANPDQLVRYRNAAKAAMDTQFNVQVRARQILDHVLYQA